MEHNMEDRELKLIKQLAGIQINESTEEEFAEVVRRMKQLADKWIPENMADYEKHKYAIKAMAQELADEIK